MSRYSCSRSGAVGWGAFMSVSSRWSPTSSGPGRRRRVQDGFAGRRCRRRQRCSRRRSARCAAVPAAWPITKQAPVTRAADCASWLIEAQRPATHRLSRPCGHRHAVGQVVEAAALGDLRPAEFDVALQVQFQRPAVDADGVVEARAVQHVRLGQQVVAAARAASRGCRPAARCRRCRSSRSPALPSGSRRRRRSGGGPASRLRSVRARRCRPSHCPAALASCVRLTRHSMPLFCGRTMGVLRGNL